MKTALLTMCLAAAAFAQSNALPAPQSGNVTLPLSEYDRLLDLANKPPKPAEAHPYGYAIQRADIKLEVTGDTAIGTVQLEGEVRAPGFHRVPLGTGLTILDARQRGKDLPVLRDGAGNSAVFMGPTPLSVALQVGVPVTTQPGFASLRFPVPAAGTVHLTLTVPGENNIARLSAGLITGRTSTNGRTTVEAVLPPNDAPVTLTWATHEVAPPPVAREVRFLSDVRTLISVSEGQIAMTALGELTIVQGEPSQFEVAIPEGFEVAGVTGDSLLSSDVQHGTLILWISGGTARTHQFLISMEKPISSTKVESPMPTFKGTQRETGELLIEGQGAMELTVKEAGGLKRMDLRESSAYLRSLAKNSMQAAFRYRREPNETPTVALEWVHFPDATLLAAVAQEATVTTLVTTEGKSLTEVRLMVSNQAQPFLKLGLPAGVSILSAEVAGDKVKPVQAPDGSRVPLLKPAFHPTGAYPVSFVFMHDGAPFAKKGGAELSLPGMDIPIGLLHWEVFLPEQYKVKDFGGDAMPADQVPQGEVRDEEAALDTANFRTAFKTDVSSSADMSDARSSLLTGQLGGTVRDQAGATVPGAQVKVVNVAMGTTRTSTSDRNGNWIVSGVPSGTVQVTVESAGFQRNVREVGYDASQPLRYNAVLVIGSMAQTIDVTAESATVNTAIIQNGPVNLPLNSRPVNKPLPSEPSSDVIGLQQRVAGALPIRVDVPHAGTSYHFVRPLVTGEETKVTFTYKSK